MNTAGKVITGAAIGGSALFAYGYYLSGEADKLEVEVRTMVHSMDLIKIVVRLDVKLKNPSRNDFDFRQPFVTLKYNTRTLGTSQASEKVTTFAAGQEKFFEEPVMITIPLINLLFLGLQVLKDLREGKAGLKASAHVQTYTTILGVYEKEIERDEEVSIRKQES